MQKTIVSLCVAALLLAIAGCGSYEPKIRTGVKAPPPRTRAQVSEDALAAMGSLEKTIRAIKNGADAKAAIPKVSEYCERMKALILEGTAIEKTMTADQLAQFQAQYAARAGQAQLSIMAAFKGLDKVPNIPPEFAKTFLSGGQEIAQAMLAAKDLPASPPPEVLPDKPSDGSCWAVWLLAIVTLGACVAFLYRDGVWNNALGLLNIIFAGLLAMNFHEPVANFLTTYSASLHPYVAFFDFLALWLCFIFFAVIFRAAMEAVSRVRVRFLKVVDLWGGVALSFCTGWVMLGFILTTLHAAPLGQYPLLGSFQPEQRMVFGMFAPDREWLGFTQYQSWGTYCRSVAEPQFQQCIFPPNKVDDRDFIGKHLVRRMHVENYIRGNHDHAILVNPQFMAPPKPAR